MKVFIAGGTGTIGQNITRALLDEGNQVVLLSRNPDNYPTLQADPNVEFVAGTVHDREKIIPALQGCDAVIDLALTMDGTLPEEILNSDTSVVCFLLGEAAKAGVKKFIFTSTVAVMGPGEDEECPIRPWGLYGATKAAGEAFVKGFHEYFASFYGKAAEPVPMLRNIIRPGETYSDPAFPGGAAEASLTVFRDIMRAVYHNEDLELDVNRGSQYISGRQIAQIYLNVLKSDCNQEVFLGVAHKFVTDIEVARLAKEVWPQSTSQIRVKGTEMPKSLKKNDKVKRVFGLDFAGDEDLKEHLEWLLDEVRREEAGETLPNTNHDHFFDIEHTNR